MRKKFVRTLWALFLGGIVLIGFGIVAIDKGWIGYMPELADLQDPIDKYSSQLISADGKVLGTWSQNANREYVTFDSISAHVFHALIATEDVRFYEHTGVDFRALGRAILKRGILRQKSAGGGSTITQQLAKQLYSKTAQSTLERLLQKPIEWVIAVELERNYTKEEIMTLYLNHFDFLYNAVGVRSASKTYFNKQPDKLTLEEAALLVGMCKNPAYYNPIRHPERCLERRNTVLEQMEKAGYLTEAEAATAKATPVETDFHRLDHKTGPAPYLREYLRRIMMAEKPERSRYASWQRQQFFEDSVNWATNPLYGWCKKNTKHNGKNYNLYTDGLKVYSTVDSRMQTYAEEAMTQHVAKYLQRQFNAQRHSSGGTFPYIGISRQQANNLLQRAVQRSERYRRMKDAGASEEEIEKAFRTRTEMNVFTYHGEVDTTMTPIDSILYYKSFLRSSLVSIDPSNGYVKAYVGGMDFKHFQYDMGVVGRRQVGSTMKPFVYSLAMEDGLTPDYTVLNVQRSYGGWTPRNGSRACYGARMPLKWGLAQSNNWITAGIMAEVDPSGRRLERLLHQAGIMNPDIQPSMALCLGTCDITACELASAYTMFLNGGLRSAPIFVTRIEDNQGNILAEFQPRQNQVIDEMSAAEMLDMLQGVANAGTARRVHGILGSTARIAAKTGTTNNNADAWFVGCVPQLVTSCWVGGEERDIHFASTGIGQGAAAALPIWAYYMKRVFADSRLGYSPRDEFPEFEYDNVGNEVYNDYDYVSPGSGGGNGDDDDSDGDGSGTSGAGSEGTGGESRERQRQSINSESLFE